MRKTLSVMGLVILLGGCSSNPFTHSHHEGLPSNSFPRHQLNFLFNEALVLDYSELNARDWKVNYQDVQGRYAMTTFIAKKETQDNWTEQFTVAFYPKITMSDEYDLKALLSFIRKRSPWPCLNVSEGQTIIKTPEEWLILMQGTQCAQNYPDMYQITRLIKTAQGIHELSLVARNATPPAADQMDRFVHYMKQAKLIQKNK